MSFKTLITRRSVLQPVDPSEAGDLKIENDRLQTTVRILNQKVKSKTHNDDQVSQLRKKNREYENQISLLRRDVLSLKGTINKLTSDKEVLVRQLSSHESTIDSLNFRLEEQRAEADKSDGDRINLRNDIALLNNKLIQLEEENFKAKRVQLDQDQVLEKQELQMEAASVKLGELMQLNQELEKSQVVYIAKKFD